MSARRLLATGTFAVALVASSSWPLVQGALARDHGVMGQTWGIAEPDLLTTIDGRLKALQANGVSSACRRPCVRMPRTACATRYR